MPDGATPPPPSCPIGWQPQPLAPVFYGKRDVGPADGAPLTTRISFPSLDGAVWSAPLLEGCGRYPLVVFVHGHCQGDPDHFERWWHLPDQLARSGYVVAVPQLSHGSFPWADDHAELAALADLVDWMRSDWEHADVLDPDRVGVAGHSWGAMLGARFAADIDATAYAGIAGTWAEWGGGPLPLADLDTPTLLVWGVPDVFTNLGDAAWDALPVPKHRAVWATAGHWDYLVGGDLPPCAGPFSDPSDCGGIGVATSDLVTMFMGRYMPPEYATNLLDDIPDDLRPPELNLTDEQAFFAGGHLVGFDMLDGEACALDLDADPYPYLANRRTRETHSRTSPCSWVSLMAPPNRLPVRDRLPGWFWCDFCFPHLADG